MSLVEGLKPYKDGNVILWQIHNLDIIDKHREIVPVGASQGNLIITTQFTPPGSQSTISTSMGLIPKDRQYPLKDNAEVMRIKKDARHSDQSGPVKEDYKLAFEIAFGEGQFVDGKNVLQTLQQFVGAVEQVIRAFRGTIFPA